MVWLLPFRRTYGIAGGLLLSALAADIIIAQQPTQRFGGTYSELDSRRQQLVDDWVARFINLGRVAVGKEDGYWKIVSWQVAPKPDETPAGPAPPEPKVVRIKADLALVDAAKNFLDTWLIRKDYDTAFRYLSTSSSPATTSSGVRTRRRQHPSTIPDGRSARVSNGSATGLASQASSRRSSRLPSRSTR